MDDMVRRALIKHLPDVTKNNFLQLNATEPSSTGRLHDLCIEMISLLETLMVTLTDKDESADIMLSNRPGADEKSKKSLILPTEQTNYAIDRLAGDVESPEADNPNQKAFEQQQIHDNEVKNEYSEESNSF